MLNHLVADGYGFVSTESTNRTTKQWNTQNLSLTSNADLARLSRLYASFVSTRQITSQTPIYAIVCRTAPGSPQRSRRHSRMPDIRSPRSPPLMVRFRPRSQLRRTRRARTVHARSQ